jgi:hypothetical protein
MKGSIENSKGTCLPVAVLPKRPPVLPVCAAVDATAPKAADSHNITYRVLVQKQYIKM